jgi:hypothetical protein
LKEKLRKRKMKRKLKLKGKNKCERGTVKAKECVRGNLGIGKYHFGAEGVLPSD